MKIVGINSSPRGERSQTLRLLRAALDGARSAGAEVELIDICKLDIKYCNACGVCYAKGECTHKDDFGMVYKKLLESDGFVIGSPNYFRSVTAQLKTLIDRMSDAIHCQLLLGKYGCAVATAGGQAYDEVLDYLSRIIVGFGAYYVGGAGGAPAIPNSMDTAEKEAFKLGKDLVSAISENKRYPEQDKIHDEMKTRFRALVSMNKDVWTHEYEHWKGKGWL